MKVLVINCGSSTVKCRLYGMPDKRPLARAVVERIARDPSVLKYRYGDATQQRDVEAKDHEQAARVLLETLLDEKGKAAATFDEITAVGHRVVHGGDETRAAVPIDESTIDHIERFAPLAPLHNPPDLAGIRTAMTVLPSVPHMACFDTTFHQSLPERAYTYALPARLRDEWGVRKYGFHGISHRFVAERAARFVGHPFEDFNAITCHLGSGCSIAAIRQGRSVDTSMGMTPLEGLVMGTRSGDVDPGVLLYLGHQGISLEELDEMWNRQSGLLGLSGLSADMRDLIRAADDGNQLAMLAVDVFCFRLKKYIGAYFAVIGEPHALVFTGGIGEHSAVVRRQTCDGLGCLGIEVDESRNESAGGKEANVAAEASSVPVLVIPANEELAIATEVYQCLQAGGERTVVR
jgi:acetate kinase